MTAPILTGVAGRRLDQFVHEALPKFSRSRIQDWIKAAHVLVDGAPRKPSFELRGGERIEVQPMSREPLSATPEDLPLTVLYEDADVVAIDKPAGMVVHAGAGVESGTLTNALLHRFQTLSRVNGEERPGIVHRLDKDTSGVILVARTDAAHQSLAAQFAGREVEKIYLALVEGTMASDSGTVDKPIARDPIRRTRMTARLGRGRTAITHWTVERRFAKHTMLRVRIGTGRTHQIRVHLQSLKHPVAGDVLYGAPKGPIDRFFLHAHRIAFTSPSTGARIAVESPLPPDLVEWLLRLE
ncbi:MAG: RluA family pseudouridine synthase [Bryobacteraceae bacterium]|nr:RluA family pseudouridine synthase [Bryobacteraceae bacterium]